MSNSELYDTVMADARARNDQCGGNDAKHYDFEVFEKYCALCDVIGTDPLPVSIPNATAYLLMRSAQGAMDCDLSNEMRFIANFHLLVDAQVRPYGDVKTRAFHSFNRALGFAQIKHNSHVAVAELRLANRCKAFEMFPNGVVPERIADVAA